jgi:hypothetical protein
LFTF